MSKRHPIYAEADIIVDSTAQPVDRTTDEVIAAVRRYVEAHRPSDETGAAA